MIKYEDLEKANKTINTMGIERKDKEGKIVVKEYAEVNQRIKAFRMVYPTGIIDTTMVSNENGVCIFRAMVGYYEDDVDGCVRWLASGTAYEKENSSFINKTSYIENCETSAVGRALGMAGFGIDMSVASAEEVQNAMLQQEQDVVEIKTREDAENYKLTFGKHAGKTIKEIVETQRDYANWLYNNGDETIKKCLNKLLEEKE